MYSDASLLWMLPQSVLLYGIIFGGNCYGAERLFILQKTNSEDYVQRALSMSTFIIISEFKNIDLSIIVYIASSNHGKKEPIN